ncbi:MAG: pseudouridine synthase [Verrucomicrobiota bacterium]
MSADGIRLNKYLASAGLGSRRAVEELVREGVVRLNSHVVTDLATRVQPEDHVTVRRRAVRPQQRLTAVLNKPRGYLCSRARDKGAKTIFELLPKNWPRVFYAGRLDKDSQGLVLLTTDGELAQGLAHPSRKVPKIYEVSLDRPFRGDEDAPRLLKGINLEGKPAKFDRIERIGAKQIRVTLTQGLKRQIRLMLLYQGYKVKRLVRTQLGGLSLGKLPVGRWRILDESELATIFDAAER